MNKEKIDEKNKKWNKNNRGRLREYNRQHIKKDNKDKTTDDTTRMV